MKKIVKKNLEIEDKFQILSLLADSLKVDLDYVIVKTYIISNNYKKVGFIYKNDKKLKLIKDKKIINNFLEIIYDNSDKFIEISDKLLRLTYDVYDIFVFKTFQFDFDECNYCNYYEYNWFIIFEKER